MIQYKLSKSIGSKNVTKFRNQYVFGYPCSDSHYNCTPYTVFLKPGKYIFESWGSRGRYGQWEGGDSTAGYGGYTYGVLTIDRPRTIYLYIGSVSYFNSMLYYKGNDYFGLGGASSDVRLYANESYDWSDPLSLRSRIMVSWGGGGSEWPGSAGGHAGGLVGGIGQSDCSNGGYSCTVTKSGGGTQTSGGTAAPTIISPTQHVLIGYPGLFGKSPVKYDSWDMGGIGGNGYYSGASLNFTGAGGGVSSFISGYEGCVALKSSNDETPNPSGSSIHYSGLFFTNASMISGNKDMPLYYSPTSHGLGNQGRGAIRITVIYSYEDSFNPRNIIFKFNHFLYLGLAVM